jgi:hypothetical protein
MRSRENSDRLVWELGYVRIKDRGWTEASRRLERFAYPTIYQLVDGLMRMARTYYAHD